MLGTWSSRQTGPSSLQTCPLPILTRSSGCHHLTLILHRVIQKADVYGFPQLSQDDPRVGIIEDSGEQLCERRRGGAAARGVAARWTSRACVWTRSCQWHPEGRASPAREPIFRSLWAIAEGLWLVDDPSGSVRVDDLIFVLLSS